MTFPVFYTHLRDITIARRRGIQKVILYLVRDNMFYCETYTLQHHS